MQISLPVHCVWRTWKVYRQQITFGDELAFHRRGLYVSGSANVTIARGLSPRTGEKIQVHVHVLPITTAADDIYKYLFIVFPRK